MRYFIFFCFVFQMLLAHSGMAQSQNDWTKDEKKFYKTLYSFSHYLHDVPWADWSMKKIFKKYVEFDYVLQDSNEYVVDRHKGLFFFAAIDFIEYVNKMGIENLDAMPARLYIQRDTAAAQLYRYLEKSDPELIPRLFFCYDRRKPDTMLAPVLFADPNVSHKILTWMIKDQAGHKEFVFFDSL